MDPHTQWKMIYGMRISKTVIAHPMGINKKKFVCELILMTIKLNETKFKITDKEQGATLKKVFSIKCYNILWQKNISKK